MTDPPAQPAQPAVLSGPWARRLILIDLALVVMLAWLLWSMWSDARDPQPVEQPPASSDVPALEGLDY